jgi:glycosyltransferase involved in cell wall biosynthesis
MRLIVDLFPAQSASRQRGIGRYTLSLARAMAAQAGAPGGAHELRLLANAAYPDSVAHLRAQFAGLTAPGAYASYTHPPMDPRNTDDTRQEQLASAVIHTAYQALGADAVLCASPFEGWNERGLVPQAAGGLPAGLKVAVLYDLIPWLFPKQHLDPVPDYKRWYARRLAALGQYDLLLAISEATRADAIRLLGLAPERVVNISGAADPQFRTLAPDALGAAALRRFGIDRPFVLYTGNSDYRKNLGGMLAAFARLPRALRDTHQLVVNQVGNIELFMLQVAAAGLDKDSVVVTGRVSDDELLVLYNACKVFVFPSLYEGFGLPVLEAMACGAAVIAGDNSSIPEVAGRADLLFDAASPDAIAASLLRALTDDAWRAALRAYGPGRAAQFSWDKTAAAAWRAIETALEARRAAALAGPVPRGAPCLRVAAVLALPAAAAGRAKALLATLAPYADIVVADEDTGTGDPAGGLSRASLPRQWNRFDTVLYVVTPAALTPDMVDLVRSAPGVLLLAGAGAAPAARVPQTDAEASQLLRDEGLQGLVARHRHEPNRTGSALPLGRSLLEALRCLVLEAGATALPQPGAALVLPELVLLDGGAQVDEAARTRVLAAALRAGADKSWRGAAAQIAAAWRGTPPGEAVIDEVARHAERNLRLNRSARILVDATRLAGAEDAGAGMVGELVRGMCLREASPTPIELVQLDEHGLVRAGATAAAIFGIGGTACPVEQIDIQPGDILFLPDPPWERLPRLLTVFAAVRQFGGRIVSAAPEAAGPADGFALAVRHSDLLLCASQAACDAARQRIAQDRLEHAAALRILPWRKDADSALALLGASFD